MKDNLKKIKLILLLSAFVFSNKSYAYDFEVDSFYYNVVSMDDMNCEITYEASTGNTYSGDIVIPENVTFKDHTFTVIGIGKSAFYNCSELKSIKLPKTISYLNHYAFQKCYNLSNIDMSESYLQAIGEYCFDECTNLESISIPGTMEAMYGYAFNDCSNLREIRFEGGESTLYFKFSFLSNTSLEKVYIGKDLCFSGYYSYWNSPFWNSTTLKNVEIGDSLTYVFDYAFRDCTLIENINIPDNVITLSKECFYGCTGVKTLTLGSGLTTIKSGALGGLESLETIYSKNTTPPYFKNDNFENKQYMNIIVYIPEGSLNAYKEDKYWGKFWNLEECDFASLNTVTFNQITKATVYTIYGRLISQNMTLDEISSLPPGLYIINGKKTLIR